MHFLKKDRKINLAKEKRDEMVIAIRQYFLKERNEEIGDLAAVLILEFILEELAPEFYNQGVSDSHRYLVDMLEDLLSIQK